MEELKKIWTKGWVTTTMIELIKEKCVVAEHQLINYWMKNGLGRKNLAQI